MRALSSFYSVEKIHLRIRIMHSLSHSISLTIGACYILLGIRMPPSNRITVPFSMEFSIPSLTILANSSGFPGLRGNSMTLVRLDLTLSLMRAVIPLSNRLGAMVTTLTPYLARSRVNGSVKDARAPFEAAYETWPGCPSKLLI